MVVKKNVQIVSAFRLGVGMVYTVENLGLRNFLHDDVTISHTVTVRSLWIVLCNTN